MLISEVLTTTTGELRRWVRVDGDAHDQDLLGLFEAGKVAADEFCNRDDWVSGDSRLPLVRLWVKKFVVQNFENRGLTTEEVSVSGLGSVSFNLERPETTMIRHFRMNPGF